ncbi:uncharacterized protein LOC126898868 [Daktulosphaira vitifoliae]|uniref:uncharacterized protein LOC126898868 n=1 Tax=Daktulosphaira vitifoliae TaxID=58002 RepID=UPI0021A9B130|nr:uncharacterized protein LOC126898868 [Daktulosphaira vitifoliae]
MLMEMKKKLYFDEDELYVYHIQLDGGSNVNKLFITNKRVAIVTNNIFGFYKLKWSCFWHELMECPIPLSNGILFHVKTKTIGLISNKNWRKTEKLIPFSNEDFIQKLAYEIKILMEKQSHQFTETCYNWKI